MIDIVHSRCAALADLAAECGAHLAPGMEAAWSALRFAVMEEHPILVCGNGGSAAQAAHFVGELLGRYRVDRRPLRAVDLTAPGAVTCIGNDYSFEHVFSRQVEAWAPDALLVCLSTSGTSANVLAAADVAVSLGVPVIAITGDCQGRGLAALPIEAHVQIPSRDVALVQELTLSVVHSLCEAIDQAVTSEEG